MSETDPTQSAQNSASAMKTIVELAAHHPDFKQAGTNLAQSARTITALIDNCLLPIAAVNYAFERGRKYFSAQFKSDLENVTAGIPPSFLIEPKASIAAPILQGLTFSHEEAELKLLFLNLLKSAMDSRTAGSAHPAFIEVIKQITCEEARLVSLLLGSAQTIPVVQIRLKSEDRKGFTVLHSHVLNTQEPSIGSPIVLARMPSMVDNWVRLALISVSYLEHLLDDAQYAWVSARPEYTDALERNSEREVYYEKGILSVTNFGKEFYDLVK